MQRSDWSRRRFLKSMTLTAAAIPAARQLHASIVRTLAGDSQPSSASITLDEGWEHYRGALDGPREVWHGDDTVIWEKVSVPHCFNHYDGCDPDVGYYRGSGWYRKHLSIANPHPNGRTLLHFEGAGQSSQVYVGGVRVGDHVGGYDEFVFDITDALAQADPYAGQQGACLAVLCDNSPDLERSPSELSDFSLYGGLYRHVHLVYVPAVSLETVHIAPSVTPRSAAQIVIRGVCYNPTRFAGQVGISIEVADPDGRPVFQTKKTLPVWSGEAELASFSIDAPALWSPDYPRLYSCRVSLETESGCSTSTERFGIRHTEFVDGGPFKLNGERLLLRGTQRHMDHAGFAAAQPDQLVREEMMLMKEMGVNFVRLAHYQQTQLVLDLCDELGILVWEEAPWCRSGIGNDEWKRQTLGMLSNLIDQHFNHPSILMWSLGNEDDWPDEYFASDPTSIRAFMRQMNDLAHRLDPSRATCIRRCDFARDIPDVYSPSIWAGWYRGVYTEYQQALETERKRVKHFIHAEWGADSHARRHSENPDAIIAKISTTNGTDERGFDYRMTGGDARISRDADWSESYACNLFDWYLKVQETLPWFTGSAQWIFKDFTTPLRPENPVPRVNQKGVLERDLAKKEGFYVFQSYWSTKPMAHIYGHTWPVRWGAEGEPRMVKVYSNCAVAELFVNGKSVGTRRRDSQNFPAAGLRWMVPFATGRNHLRVVAHKGDATVTDEIDFDYQTAKWEKPARLALAVTARDAHAATVEATLFDRHGVLCLDAKNVVHFSVAGNARLMDNLGTSSGSRVIEMYNGRARISIALDGSGSAEAGVTAAGIKSAFVSIA